MDFNYLKCNSELLKMLKLELNIHITLLWFGIIGNASLSSFTGKQKLSTHVLWNFTA